MVADGDDYGTTDRFWILRKLDVYHSPPEKENEMRGFQSTSGLIMCHRHHFHPLQFNVLCLCPENQ